MSQNGQMSAVEAGGTVLVGAFTLEDRSGFVTHQHSSHQLAWASSGVLTMGVAEKLWVLPRARALWIPAGIDHDVLAGGETRFVSLYFEPDGCPIHFDEPTVIDSDGLLGHLMDHLSTPLAQDARHRAESVLFDLIQPMPAAELALPTPTDERVRQIAAALERDPADQRTLAEWGSAVGASSRTLSRAIHRDTGMTFATWRTHIRIAAALRLLAQHVSVTQVGIAVGYATPSAFVAAFKRTVGATPGQYFA